MAYLDKETGLTIPGSAPGESGGGSVDLSFITAEAEDIRAGKVGANPSGGQRVGTLRVSGMEFYKCAAVHGPRTVIRINVANAGTTAVNGDYEKTDLTTESGGEVWKHISAEYYIYPDSWGIVGIYSDYPPSDGALYYCTNNETGKFDAGIGSLPAPTATKGTVTVDEDVPKTWDGYKAVLTDGFYSFEETLITGLTYGASYVPEIGNIYSADAMAIIDGLYLGDPVSAIPTGFTSNTSISGYVINQSSGSGSYPEAWVVFNQNKTTGDYAWWTGDVGISASSPGWFSIEVPEVFRPIGIYIMNEISSPQNFKDAIFQGSNDGQVWEDLLTIKDSPNVTGYEQTHTVYSRKEYKFFRMLFTASHSPGVSIQAFEIFRNGSFER